MSIEIEKKYRLTGEQRKRVLENLRQMGAEYKGEDFEENSIFQSDFLVADGGALRIRKTADKTILTYKKRIRNEIPIKQQIEYETEVGDAEAIEKIVENLGCVKTLVYEKQRKTWHFRRVEIVIDELAFGSFMEIEGSITAIAEAEMLLDIEDFEVEHQTYPRLTAKLGKQNDGVIEARFVRK